MMVLFCVPFPCCTTGIVVKNRKILDWHSSEQIPAIVFFLESLFPTDHEEIAKSGWFFRLLRAFFSRESRSLEKPRKASSGIHSDRQSYQGTDTQSRTNEMVGRSYLHSLSCLWCTQWCHYHPHRHDTAGIFRVGEYHTRVCVPSHGFTAFDDFTASIRPGDIAQSAGTSHCQVFFVPLCVR